MTALTEQPNLSSSQMFFKANMQMAQDKLINQFKVEQKHFWRKKN